jgi:hypothetical protein
VRISEDQRTIGFTLSTHRVAPKWEKALFTGWARAFLPNNEGQFLKWEKWVGLMGEKAFNSWFQAFLRGWVGQKAVLGRMGRNCFDNQTPKKGLFFRKMDGFGIVF